ncbi:MAG: TerB family tellurite resistance protein [Thermoguttaceae bacterium]|nr:TerB family tellurite resistance protein [Thermoguttaceae bacterium]
MDTSTFFLTEDNIRFHICMLKKIAVADGYFSESEQRFIEEVAGIYCSSIPNLNPYQLLEATITEEEYVQNLEKLSSFQPRARLLLKDLISLGHIDGDYSDPEKKLVRDIGGKMNIPEDVIAKLEGAVEDLIKATAGINAVLYS